MKSPRVSWKTTTHRWATDVDVDHLLDVRRRASWLAADDATHLVLEVLAYADEEAADRGETGSVQVAVHDGEVSIVDDGRGTDTRQDESGVIVRKPVMATKDVRFFDASTPPLLPDGRPRRGMSVVAAMSKRLTHENHRNDGGWSQTYRYGIPEDELVPLELSGRTGTTVRFRCSGIESLSADTLRALSAHFEHIEVTISVAPASNRATNPSR